MNSLFFLASTMLIVLISQHSTIALPLNETAFNGSCTEGLELIEGRCVPIKGKFNDNHIESSSTAGQITIIRNEESASLLETSTFRRDGSCPPGTVHGAHGICEKVESNDRTSFTSQPTDITSTKFGEQAILQRCPEGTRRGEKGVCETINAHDKIENTTESLFDTTTTSSTTESSVPTTTLSSERHIPERCPKGRRLNADGVCERIQVQGKITSTTESQFDSTSTTTLSTTEPSTSTATLSSEQHIPERCPKGRRLNADGVCERIQGKITTTTESEFDTTTTTSTERSVLEYCPEGTVRGVGGLCEKVELNERVPSTSQATNDMPIKFGEQDVLQRCPKGTRRGENGVCEKIQDEDKVRSTTESNVEMTSTTTEQGIRKDCPEGTVRGMDGVCEKVEADEQFKPKKQSKDDQTSKTSDKVALKRCSKGQKLNADGVCEKITVEDDRQTKDEKLEETNTKSAESDLPKGCPEGTKADEQGACIGKKPYTPAKTVTNLKLLLNDDGSCPESYKLIEGRCLYVKSTQDSKHLFNFFTNDDNTATDLQSKNLQNDMVKYELVPVLEDNSCPKGTQYSSYGLCRRVIPASTPSTIPTGDEHCPPTHEFVKGKCTPKRSEVEDLMDLTTKTGKTKKPFSDSESNSEGRPSRFTTTTTKTTPFDE